MPNPINLTRAELYELTDRSTVDGQIAQLHHLGIPFKRRTDGGLVVGRDAAVAALNAQNRIQYRNECRPNFEAVS